MPMTTDGALARLAGQVTIEEAETLAAWLRSTPDGALDLSDCETLHSAVLQVLLAAAPPIAAPPSAAWLAALLPTPAAEIAA
jgi:hypothetical protein